MAARRALGVISGAQLAQLFAQSQEIVVYFLYSCGKVDRIDHNAGKIVYPDVRGVHETGLPYDPLLVTLQLRKSMP